MFNLENKIALVTGASSGIGSATAKLFHALGATVILSGTNEYNLAKISKELNCRNHILNCDLRDKEQTEQLIDKSIDLCGSIDILVCNAGITKDNLTIRMSYEDWIDVININLTSAFILNKSAIKYMLKKKYGKIINVSSIVGTMGNAGQSNYAAAKSGLIAMSKSIAQEVASRNINVNVVSPGFIETPMTDKLNDNQKDILLKSIPNSRFGKPEDVANIIAYLSSDKSDYITGQTIHVNGGMLMV